MAPQCVNEPSDWTDHVENLEEHSLSDGRIELANVQARTRRVAGRLRCGDGHRLRWRGRRIEGSLPSRGAAWGGTNFLTRSCDRDRSRRCNGGGHIFSCCSFLVSYVAGVFCFEGGGEFRVLSVRDTSVFSVVFYVMWWVGRGVRYCWDVGIWMR